MQRIFLLAFLLVSLSSNAVFAQQLSQNAQISLLIASPGTEVYNTFGHSAFRIKDPNRNLDIVFDYGVFDFETPNFIGKFVRGKLPYRLAVRRFVDYEDSYSSLPQSVNEYILNLNNSQQNKLFAFLLENNEPENRYYLYDFFYDNCATVIRDILEKESNPEIKAPDGFQTLPFRHYLDECLVDKYWLDFGIDLILGLEADKIADMRMQMFLPGYLASNLSHYYIQKDGSEQSIIASKQLLFPKKPFPKGINWFLRPFFIMCLISLSLGLLYHFLKARWLANALYIIFGLGGAFLLFMWLGTDHQATYRNLNMIWINPFYLLLPFLGWKNQQNPWYRYLLLFLLACNIVVLGGWNLLPQQFHAAIIPLIALMGFILLKNIMSVRNKR